MEKKLFRILLVVMVLLLAFVAYQDQAITELEINIEEIQAVRDKQMRVIDSLKIDFANHQNIISDAETILLDTTKPDFFKLKLLSE